MAGTLDEWYQVEFDETYIYQIIQGKKTSFHWDHVIRVCMKLGDLFESDEIYMFTSERPESYLIPTEAAGGLELWNEIIHRGLFDAELAISIASKDEGLYCWPPISQQKE